MWNLTVVRALGDKFQSFSISRGLRKSQHLHPPLCSSVGAIQVEGYAHPLVKGKDYHFAITGAECSPSSKTQLCFHSTGGFTLSVCCLTAPPSGVSGGGHSPFFIFICISHSSTWSLPLDCHQDRNPSPGPSGEVSRWSLI